MKIADDESNYIKELIKVSLQLTDSLNEDLEAHTLALTDKDGSTFKYIFKNGRMVDSDGKRIGVIIEQDLAELVGTTINNHSIILKDGYYTAKRKITDPLIEETYYNGAMCSFYDTFSICHYEKESGGLHAYYIYPANKITTNDISAVLNQKLEVIEWKNEMEGGYSYSADIMTESGSSYSSFNENSSQSIIESLTFVPD